MAVVIGSIIGAGPPAASPASAAPSDRPPAKVALDQQIADASGQLEIVIEQYNAGREALKATKAKEAAVSKRLAPLTEAMREAQAKVGSIVAGVYETTTLSPFAALLNASSASDAVNQLSTLDQLARWRRQQINALYAAADTYLKQRKSLVVLDTTQSNQQGILHAKRFTIIARIGQLKSMRLAAYGVTGMPTGAPVIDYVPVYSPDAAGHVVRFAFRQIGKAYRWATAGPRSYDCSGLVLAAWKTVGVTLPHNAAMQWRTVAHVAKANIRPGDLVFYFTPIHHVALYIGAGKIIQAPELGRPVSIAKIGFAPIHGYGRPGRPG